MILKYTIYNILIYNDCRFKNPSCSPLLYVTKLEACRWLGVRLRKEGGGQDTVQKENCKGHNSLERDKFREIVEAIFLNPAICNQIYKNYTCIFYLIHI